MHGHIIVCLTIHLLKDIWALSSFGLLQINFIETFRNKLYVNISLHLSRLNAKDCDCWKTEYLVSMKFAYCFAELQCMIGLFFISLPAFGVATIFHFSNSDML